MAFKARGEAHGGSMGEPRNAAGRSQSLVPQGLRPIGLSQRQMDRLVASATTFAIFLAIFPMGAATRPMYSFSEYP